MNTLQSFPSTLKSRILDKVKNNKLTIIVGPTGCGKSSIVPQVLLDEFGSPILCTQPRRLAVVAVSTHVASQRGSVLGEEIGYHVGQDRVANRQTGLLFATAGILLEELKGNGLEALTRYKVVLIDECHERSCESDLCLTIIKEFMMAYPRCKLRLILMSATFNHFKYTNFFRGVPGCEYVDTITIQTANSIDMFYSRVETFYLESITKMLSRSGNYNDEIQEYCTDMKFDPMQELTSNESGKLLSGNLLEVIRSLAEYLHKIEALDKIFLIFTPTYRK
jgi:HrpA-like RNA helicase